MSMHDLPIPPAIFNAYLRHPPDMLVTPKTKPFSPGDMLLLREWRPHAETYTDRTLLFMILTIEPMDDGRVRMTITPRAAEAVIQGHTADGRSAIIVRHSEGLKQTPLKAFIAGTRLRATLYEQNPVAQLVRDENDEAHVITGEGRDAGARAGDKGVLSLVEIEGRAVWQFMADT